MERHVWAVVAIVLGALASVTAVAVSGATSADLLQVISAAVVPTVTILLVGGNVSSKVDKVEKQVNGRMSQLIDAATAKQNGDTE